MTVAETVTETVTVSAGLQAQAQSPTQIAGVAGIVEVEGHSNEVSR